MNNRLLKSYMVAKGLTGMDMAAACKMSYSAWINKTQGRNEFTVGEAMMIKDVLSLSNTQISDVFFATRSE